VIIGKPDLEYVLAKELRNRTHLTLHQPVRKNVFYESDCIEQLERSMFHVRPPVTEWLSLIEPSTSFSVSTPARSALGILIVVAFHPVGTAGLMPSRTT
jgi:hypothetical protein